MGNSEEKYDIFDDALQTVVYPKSKHYAASWLALTFLPAVNIYAIGIHNFYGYFTKNERI